MGSVLEDKSFQFAIRIVELNSYLRDNRKEFVMSKQISLKEANETKYWLRLLYATKFIDDSHRSLMNDCDELLRILTATCKTTKQ